MFYKTKKEILIEQQKEIEKLKNKIKELENNTNENSDKRIQKDIQI